MALELFKTHNAATAIFASNDMIAFGVIKAALEAGIRIPEDISLFGFDDVEVAGIVHPPLTTIRQARHEMGAAAVDVLLPLADGKNRTVEHRILGVELVERASVR